MKTLYFQSINDDLLIDLVGRESLLWITSCLDENFERSQALAKLVEVPWRAVLVENSSPDFISAIDSASGSADWVPIRGYLHVIASDPSDLVLPRRSQPVFLLGGRAGSSDPGESTLLSSRGTLRRRLNMVARVATEQPKRIYVVGPNPLDALDDIIELWNQGTRALLTFVCNNRDHEPAIRERLTNATGLSSIVWIDVEDIVFANQVIARASALFKSDDLLIRIKLPAGKVLDVNLAPAALDERPLTQFCEFIPARSLFALGPSDLTDDEVKSFFTRREVSWRPYSAGLPWLPDTSPIKTVLKQLNDLLHDDSHDSPPLLTIYAESGSGGTTLARQIAFSAAQEGYIPVLAKQHFFAPSALEISNFMYSAINLIKKATSAASVDASDGEPAWLVVLDVEHFDRQESELMRFFSELVRSGRKFILLKVMDPASEIELPKDVREIELANIGHALDQSDAADLGDHLNRFLKPHGRDKTIESWLSFWNHHRPDIDTGLASFWIALEFWLAGYLDLGESIQQWLLNQFKNAHVSDEVKRGLMEIATLSIERRAMPETLLPKLVNPSLPWQQALGELRQAAPAMGAVRVRVPDLGNVWAIAHDVLARYLVNAVHRDILFCQQLGVVESADSVGFRLNHIRAICSRPAIKDVSVRPLVLSLVTSILKLDEKTGNAEFFPYWRDVLEILDNMPAIVRHESRAFNHHLAISRRRICQGEIFDATIDEQLIHLIKAEKEVRFAIERISSTSADESDLNLYNTLALIYQDLASLERRTTNRKDLIADFLLKSDDATKRALRENPSNSYVLETAARNLLRRIPDLEEAQQISSAAEALSFVQQAFTLDSAVQRRQNLGKLADEALNYLRLPSAAAQIDRLCAQGSPFGYMAKAWLYILGSVGSRSITEMMDDIDPKIARGALEILESATEKEWPLVRFMYELQAASAPLSFDKQLLLLEELSSFPGYRLSLQQQLEWAVLLHQRGRHPDGIKMFSIVRREAKATGMILSLPIRLRWLYTPDTSGKLICNAQFVDHGVGRASAQVRELAGSLVPLRPQEFGKDRMAPGERFRCLVSFGPMGPFLKPREETTK